MTKLHAYRDFAGNTEEAFHFYRSVFGGEFISLVRFKDFPMEGVNIPKEDEDKIMHVRLPVGDDDVLMASDTLPSLGQELIQETTSTSRSTRRAKRRRTDYSTRYPREARLRCRSPTRRGAITTEVPGTSSA